MKKFSFSLFEKEDYLTYQKWFDDPWLNKALGPIDEEWLDYVLSTKEGAQYCIWEKEELIVVIGLVWGNKKHRYHTLSDFAVRPSLRGKGLGVEVMTYFLQAVQLPEELPIHAHVMPDNKGAFQFFSKLGWKVLHLPNLSAEKVEGEDDMYTFRLKQ